MNIKVFITPSVSFELLHLHFLRMSMQNFDDIYLYIFICKNYKKYILINKTNLKNPTRLCFYSRINHKRRSKYKLGLALTRPLSTFQFSSKFVSKIFETTKLVIYIFTILVELFPKHNKPYFIYVQYFFCWSLWHNTYVQEMRGSELRS